MDISPTDPSARLTRTIRNAGTYYVAVRDESSRTVKFRVSRGPVAAAAPACSSDAACGGGSGGAMCFIDRCVTVSDSGFVGSHVQGPVRAAYGAAGDLRVAYQQWSQSTVWGQSSTFSIFVGPPGAAQSVASGASASAFHLFALRPGEDPVLADGARDIWGNASMRLAGGIVARLASREQASTFAFGRNAAGTTFAAIAVTKAYPANTGTYGSESCTVQFTSRPAGGTWAPLERVDGCSSLGGTALAVHVRKDGGADVVAASDYGGIRLYKRPNPIDPWARTMLVERATASARGAFVATPGGDGRTHLVAQPYDFTSNASRGDYTATYLELGDEGIVRTIPLGTHREQYRLPYPDMALDGDGNVWIQKRLTETNDRASVVRIDPGGAVAERSVGLLAQGSWPASALAVSPRGEIAIVHTGNSRDVAIRKFSPIAR